MMPTTLVRRIAATSRMVTGSEAKATTSPSASIAKRCPIATETDQPCLVGVFGRLILVGTAGEP